MTSINSDIQKINDLVRNNQFDEALACCELLITQYPESLHGLRNKAYVVGRKGERQEAFLIRKHIIELGTREPVDYFNLAGACLAVDEHEECLSSAEYAIQLGKERDYHYYDNECLFYKIVALYYLKRYDEVLKNSPLLEEDYDFYVPEKGLIKLQDMVKVSEQATPSNRQRTWKFDE